MFIQCKQAECFEDKKGNSEWPWPRSTSLKTTSVSSKRLFSGIIPKSLCSLCTSIDNSITESSVIISDYMVHGKLAVNCFQAKIIRSLKAKHPTTDSAHRLLFGWCMQLVQTEVPVYKCDILAITAQSLIPTELLRDVLWERCLSGLVMMHWRYRSRTVKSGASPMCLHFPCQCRHCKSWIQ